MSRFARISRLGLAWTVSGCIFLAFLCVAVTLSNKSYWNARLLKAVEICDDRLAINALNHGANPDLKFIYTNRVDSIQSAYWWLVRDERIYWHEEPLLTEVCESHDLALMQELVRHGADIQARDRAGRTALFTAVVNDGAMKSTRLAEFLLEKGAVLSVKDDEGHTALDEAVSDGNGPNSPVVQLLRRRVTDNTVVDRR